MTEKQTDSKFKQGNIGARQRRNYRPRRQGLTASYRRVLSEKCSQTGKTFGRIIAENMVQAVVAGDLSKVLCLMDSGARESIEKQMDLLVAEGECSRLQASMALRIFDPAALIYSEDILAESAV